MSGNLTYLRTSETRTTAALIMSYKNIFMKIGTNSGIAACHELAFLTCNLLQSYCSGSLTAREISLAAGWGPPHENLAPLKQMITDLSKQKVPETQMVMEPTNCLVIKVYLTNEKLIVCKKYGCGAYGSQATSSRLHETQSGVKVPCSILRTPSSYWRFFHFHFSDRKRRVIE